MGFFRRGGGAKREGSQEVPQVEPPTISGAEMQRLWADGIPGVATIIDMRDTGERRSGNTVIDLDVRVARAGEEPYEATLRLPVTEDGAGAYEAGSAYNVRVDPQDQRRLVFSL